MDENTGSTGIQQEYNLETDAISLGEESLQADAKRLSNQGEPDNEQIDEPAINETGTDDEHSNEDEEDFVSARIFPIEKLGSQLEDNNIDNSYGLLSSTNCEEHERGEKCLNEMMEKIHIVSEKLLPETVTILTSDKGNRVYVVGTAHFSEESQADVVKTIQMVRPDVVMLELCKARCSVLKLSEKTILEDAGLFNFAKMRHAIREQGAMQALLYMLLVSTTAHITKELGMAPGGEFRTAYNEVKLLPNCNIVLGDRPITITLSRVLSSLSVWRKIKLFFHILFSKDPISKEDVEKCKNKDFMDEFLKEMIGQFPEIYEVFVKERDIYLSRSLMSASEISSDTPLNNPGRSLHRAVVGVVGIGHVAGIVENWNKVSRKDVERIMIIPPSSKTEQIFLFTLKYSFYGCVAFATYKCLPKYLKSNLYSVVNSVSANILYRLSQ